MSSFIEKLGSYHILTNLIPGAFFALLADYLFDIHISTESIVEDVVIYYFTGLLISRVGSLIVTPLLRREWGKRKYAFIRYAYYGDYIKASKIDAKIDILSETNDVFRNLLTCSILLPFLTMFMNEVRFCIDLKWVSIPLLIGIFLFSYKEYTSYINERVCIINKQQAEKENSTNS